MSPKQEFSIPDLIRSPTGSPMLHTIIETEEEREEEGEKQEERLIVERIDFLEEKTEQAQERDAIKHLQKEEIIASSSTSSPLVTSDDSDVAAFLSKVSSFIR